jgi:4-hydroxy-4-methyl-2-oxoglutarate aldolase
VIEVDVIGQVWLRVNRVDAETCRAASTVTVADLHESIGEEARKGSLMSPRMRPVLSDARVAGPALTAWCPAGDNLMMHRALSLARRGDVLVVVCEEEDSAAQWGDVATTYAMKIGLAGVVVQGSVRDVATLRRLGFAVWSTVISPMHPDKQGRGFVNAPMRCAGVTVNPGDLVAGDADGIVVIARADAGAVVARAVARAEAEDRAALAIQGGATPWDLSGAATSYASLHFEEHDAAYDDERREKS